jgi:hypothetical protein
MPGELGDAPSVEPTFPTRSLKDDWPDVWRDAAYVKVRRPNIRPSFSNSGTSERDEIALPVRDSLSSRESDVEDGKHNYRNPYCHADHIYVRY